MNLNDKDKIKKYTDTAKCWICDHPVTANKIAKQFIHENTPINSVKGAVKGITTQHNLDASDNYKLSWEVLAREIRKLRWN